MNMHEEKIRIKRCELEVRELCLRLASAPNEFNIADKVSLGAMLHLIADMLEKVETYVEQIERETESGKSQ